MNKKKITIKWILQRMWWGFREAFKSPIIAGLYIVLIVGIVDRSIATVFMLFLMLNYVCENKEA